MTNPASSPFRRRSFLKAAGLGAAGVALGLPQIVSSRVFGANEKLTLAHIGVGGMGTGHLGYMLARQSRGDLNVAAVCDVDANRLADRQRRCGEGTDAYHDYRRLLQRKDIDAVVVATPDHWHAAIMVHAAESGKHVYVEKPACCTIEEGRAMVAAAKRNRVVVQVGSQGRSQKECYLAHRYIANGMIGRVHTVECWHYESPVDKNPLPDTAPPPELDWDFWLGPLRWRPYNRRYCHGTFRWIMESGGGQIRDRGAHVMSNALWIMGADHTGPVEIEATGTLPKYGLWDTAVKMHVEYRFKNPDWKLIWAQPGKKRPYFDPDKRKRLGIRDGYGAVYHGTKDSLIVWVGDGQVFTEPKAVKWQPPAGAKDVYRSPNFDHREDWMQAIKKGTQPVMNIEAGVATANLTVLGNLSFVLRRPLKWDPARREIVGDPAAHRLMSRPQRYPYCL